MERRKALRDLAPLALVSLALFWTTPASGGANPGTSFTPAQAAIALLGKNAPYWRPKVNEINAAEARFPAYLSASKNPNARAISAKLPSYGRQYLGVTIDGKRILMINGFCDPERHANRRTQLVQVLDGGSCYFQAYYDPQAKRFIGLAVNGLA